jgi:hypothetical protein
MTNTNTTQSYGMLQSPIEKAYEEAGERIEQVEDVKADLSFIGIFSNLIKKMDDAAQSAQ